MAEIHKKIPVKPVKTRALQSCRKFSQNFGGD